VSFNEDYTHSVTIVELEEHGSSPVLRTWMMPTLRPVITIPEKEPAEFEDALRLLEEFPDDKEAYIRLNVKVKQYGGADWAARAAAATETKKCRYCCIQLQSDREDDADQAFIQFSQEEMKALDPIEIAKLHWRQTNGCDMDAELQEKILSVIREKDEE
jgi:exonuclease SbcD